MNTVFGHLSKMSAELGDEIHYYLNLSEKVAMNDLIGKKIQLNWTGIINCQKCD